MYRTGLLIGLFLVFSGLLVILLSALSMPTTTESAVVVFIGPFPVVFASSRRAALLALIFAFLSMVFILTAIKFLNSLGP